MKIDIRGIIEKDESLHKLLHESLIFRLFFKRIEEDMTEEELVYLVALLIKSSANMAMAFDLLIKNNK